MKIALDFNDTITAWPNELRHLAQALMVPGSGNEVHIVSACLAKNSKKTAERIEQAGIPHTAKTILYYVDYDGIAALKIPTYKRLGIELIFDDNRSVVDLAILNGMMAVLVQGHSHRGIL